MTAKLEYLTPGLSCKPIFGQFKYTIPLTQGVWDRQSGTFDSGVTALVSNNVTFDNVEVGKFETNIATLKYVEKKFTIRDGNRTIRIIDLGASSVPGENGCRLALSAYRTGCGIGRNQTILFGDSLISGDGTEESCDDGILFLTYQQCSPDDESSAIFSMSLLECVSDNRYGKCGTF